jgi:hypothetical protein
VLARIHRREVDSRNDLQGLLLLLTALLNPETSVKPMVHVVSGYVKKPGFPEIQNSSTVSTRIRHLGEALQIFRIPVDSVREFRIPVEATAIPDSSIQLHWISVVVLHKK